MIKKITPAHDPGRGEEVFQRQQLRAVRAAAGEREDHAVRRLPNTNAMKNDPVGAVRDCSHCASRTAGVCAQIPASEFAARRDSLAQAHRQRRRDRVRRPHAGRGLRTVSPAAGVSLPHELRRAGRRVRHGGSARLGRRRCCSSRRPIRARRSTTAGAPTRPRCAERSASPRDRRPR